MRTLTDDDLVQPHALLQPCPVCDERLPVQVTVVGYWPVTRGVVLKPDLTDLLAHMLTHE